MNTLLAHLPAYTWLRSYDRATLRQDIWAAAIVTVMLIPQSLAYAMLAGLPAQVGLYASIVPLLMYALLGSSRVLAVGPVAIVSLMTATTIQQHSDLYSAWQVAITLACLSGGLLLLMGMLRLGFFANFLSHPVISGFMTASALLIALGQLAAMTGIKTDGRSLWALLQSVNLSTFNALSFVLGTAALLLLYWGRVRCKQPVCKVLPMVLLVLSALLVYGLDIQVKTVGEVPQGLPPLTLPVWDVALWQQLLLPALLISIVGFVESVSVGQTLAAKHRLRIEPNQELLALGAANLGAGLSGGFPVTGGFARSVVNFDAGARTQLAGVMAAAGIVLVVCCLTPWLYYLPQAVLSATIVVAVMSLLDIKMFAHAWQHTRADFVALLSTVLMTLLAGVEIGLMVGVGVSLALFLYHTSQPHIAEVGQVPGTEHFRNVLHHQVITYENVISIRVDESLYFANTRALEDYVNAIVARHPQMQHLVLQCSAINDIDRSALESLSTIEQRLFDAGITLHFSEVKAPVMHKLQHVLQGMHGKVFLSHFQAVLALAPAMMQAESG